MVIEAYRNTGRGIVVPVFNGKRGHPLLIGHKYLEEIALLGPEQGLKDLARKYYDDVLEVEAGTADILKDIDTEKDYWDELRNI